MNTKKIMTFLLMLTCCISLGSCAYNSSTEKVWVLSYNKLIDEAAEKAFSTDDIYSNHYIIYDIDKNNIPELLIKSGKSEADYIYQIYTYSQSNNKSETIGKIDAGHIHSLFGSKGSKNSFYTSATHMGQLIVNKYTLEGAQINTEKIFEDELTDDIQLDYMEDTLELSMYALNDKTGLYKNSKKDLKTASTTQAEYNNLTLQNISEINCTDEDTLSFQEFVLNDIGAVLDNNAQLLHMLDRFNSDVYNINCLKDAYIIDADNDDENELILIFQEDDGGYTGSMLIENAYDEMKIRTDIELYADGGGTSGRWYSKLLRDSDNKTYLFHYSYGHVYENNLQKSSFNYKLSTFNSKEETVIFNKHFHQETDENNEYRNLYEVNSAKVTSQQYEAEYYELSAYLEKLTPCIDAEKMNGYDLQEKDLSYGKDLLKFMTED